MKRLKLGKVVTVSFLFSLLALLIFSACCAGEDDGDSEDEESSGDDDSGNDDDNSTDDDDDDGDETSWALQSPGGRIEITVALKNLAGTADFPEEEALYFSVKRDGQNVLDDSPLGIETDSRTFLTDLRFVQSSKSEINETYEMKTGKRSLRTVNGNQMTLQFENQNGAPLEMILRAHDDGVAFRYRLPGDGEVDVLREFTGFAVPPGSTGFLFPYDSYGLGRAGNYENEPQVVPAGTRAPASGWAFPALFEIPCRDAWLLLTEADLDGSYCGTRLDRKPVGTLYRIRFPHLLEGGVDSATNPRAALPLTTPWRVMILGDLAAVVESTLVDDLSRPASMEDTDWIQPGPVNWSWWSQGTGGEALQREYVQFAAEMDWRYTLIDAGWPNWPDVETVMPALVSDAADLGIGVILWYHSLQLPMVEPLARRAELDKLLSWGVPGIKVDFFESDKQDRIRLYLDILADAADRQILVNFHGATISRGWQRTYPNLMTQEAVMGAEYLKWSFRPTPRTDVILAFTRNVIGSMDYTPVTFSRALNRVGSTYAHSLALSVAFESGWQHLADRADANPAKGYRAVFSDYPFVADFMTAIPTAWDETRFLDGDPRTHVVLARRKGETWYVAGLNGPEEVDVAFPLSFLDAAVYGASLIRMGPAPDSLEEMEGEVSATDQVDVPLAPRDGFVMKLVPL